MSFSQKRYRIEDSLRRDPIIAPKATNGHGALNGFAPALPAATPEGGDPRLDTILATVREMRQLLDPAHRVATDVIEAYRKEISEVYALRNEIDAMKAAITQTKREIASLYKSDEQGKGMRRVAGELDAVVSATEEATGSILSGLEDIETHVNMLRASGAVKSANDEIGAILDRVVSMYEACNFQDLTGQRITKIVNVLKFVEERLDKMIDVWGGLDAFQELIQHEAIAPALDDEKALLNGPKLEEDAGHVSQDDIDSLFD